MMAQAKKQGTNWFAVLIATVTVVAVAGIGMAVWWMNSQVAVPNGEQAKPSGSMINVETGAISFGDGEKVVATYVDFACPGCNSFEQMYGEYLISAADADKITLDVHPIAIVRANQQHTGYSTLSASAMYCVVESATTEQSLNFFAKLFELQGEAPLSDNKMVQAARDVGADAASTCIRSHRYAEYVDTMTRLTPPNANGQISTPTVVIDGTRVADPFKIHEILPEVFG
jgi:protein-disulfide isomerase